MFGELLRFTAPPKFRLDPSEDLKSLIIPPWVNLRISNLSACDRSTPGDNKDSATCCWTLRFPENRSSVADLVATGLCEIVFDAWGCVNIIPSVVSATRRGINVWK